MIKKDKLIFGIFIFLVLIMLNIVYAFDYNEDKNGDPFLESEFNVKVPQINIRDLFTLQPSSEPLNPEVGMIYFDSDSKRLKLYDGTGWYAVALEKVSSVSKQQVKETIEKKSEVKTCSESTECGEWGDCINNYQSMICVTIDESCNKYEDSETRDCVSDFELESSAKESHNIEVEETTEEEKEEASEEESEESIEDEEEESETEIEEIEEESEESIEDDEPVEETSETEEEIPEELFDITFDLEEKSIMESERLVVWITLQNFGKRYVPARLIYSIIDETGEEVYRKFEEVRVYTDESIIKRFDDLVLEEGDYVLSLRVEYAGIVEEFSDYFSVEKGIFGSIKRFFMRLF